MKQRSKSAFKTISLLILASVLALILSGIQGVFTGTHLAMLNPITSGFLHVSTDHFLTNIIVLFLLLLAPINYKYDFKRIFWITLLISLAYLPISLSGLTQPAVGLSGSWFFLASRFFLTWNKFKNLGKGIILIFAIAEFNAQFDSDPDMVAHIVHLFGILFGWISLKWEDEIFPHFISQKSTLANFQ